MSDENTDLLKENIYICSLCDENMIDNDRIICPFCKVEICETCFQYGINIVEHHFWLLFDNKNSNVNIFLQ